MDQDVAQAFAEIRQQLAQLRSALGVQTPDQAEAEVMGLKQQVAALTEWGATVSPPFSPPAAE